MRRLSSLASILLLSGTLAAQAPVPSPVADAAERGDVDMDGNGTIDLSGADRQAIVKATVVLTIETGASIDLTPPYVADDTLIDPDSGWLSCRQQGAGRMAGPEVIAEAVQKTLADIRPA